MGVGVGLGGVCVKLRGNFDMDWLLSFDGSVKAMQPLNANIGGG